MACKVGVVIRDVARQYEGLRVSLGLLLEAHVVTMIVLNHEIQVSEEYLDNMEFIDEMGGARLSDVAANVARHGFRPIAPEQVAGKIRDFDVVIPF